MNKTDRMLAIVLELQGRGTVRAEDLAAIFETSKRTIYRDIQALSESGVPITSTPGRGYALMEGYFLPPVSLTMEEASILVLGCNYLTNVMDVSYQQAAQSAIRKINSVLPELIRHQVDYWQQNIQFVFADVPTNEALRHSLQRIRRAILENTTIHFRYYARVTARGPASLSERSVDPYSLWYQKGTWYLIGYCHLRQAIRNFRLERMEDLQVLSQYFQRPSDLQSETNIDHRMSETSIRVNVLFAPEIARWIQESESFFMESREETPEGLLVTFLIHQEEDILHDLLGWGKFARVVSPLSLRKRLIEAAREVIDHHQAQEDGSE